MEISMNIIVVVDIIMMYAIQQLLKMEQIYH